VLTGIDRRAPSRRNEAACGKSGYVLRAMRHHVHVSFSSPNALQAIHERNN
jgi:hypothetical protein